MNLRLDTLKERIEENKELLERLKFELKQNKDKAVFEERQKNKKLFAKKDAFSLTNRLKMNFIEEEKAKFEKTIKDDNYIKLMREGLVLEATHKEINEEIEINRRTEIERLSFSLENSTVEEITRYLTCLFGSSQVTKLLEEIRDFRVVYL